jgi:hypothetical protein
VPVQLPLEGLVALGEYLHLPRNQPVELVALEAVEVVILDHPASPVTNHAQQGTVLLDTNTIRKPVVNVRPQLRVIGAEQRPDVLISSHEKTLTFDSRAEWMSYGRGSSPRPSVQSAR